MGEKSARLNISETRLNLSVRIALIASSALNYGNPLNLEGHLRRGGTAVLRRSTVREERVGEKSARLNISKTRLNLDVGIAPNEQELSVPCTLRPCTPTTLNPKPSFRLCRTLQPLPHAPASAACFSLCHTLQPLPHASASAVRLALVMLESDLTLSRLYEETLYPYRD